MARKLRCSKFNPIKEVMFSCLVNPVNSCRLSHILAGQGSFLSRCLEPSSPSVRQFDSNFHSNRPCTYSLSGGPQLATGTRPWCLDPLHSLPLLAGRRVAHKSEIASRPQSFVPSGQKTRALGAILVPSLHLGATISGMHNRYHRYHRCRFPTAGQGERCSP